MLISRIRKKTQLIIWVFLGIFVIFGVFFTYGVFMPGGRGNRQLMNREGGKAKIPDAVVSVDGRKVDMQLFTYKYLQFKRQYENYSGAKFDTYPMQMYLKSLVLEQMINQELLLEEARKRGVRGDSAEIGKRINDEKNFLIGPASKPTETGPIASVKAYFANKERDKQFHDGVVRMGVSYDTFRSAIRRDVIQTKVIDLIAADELKKETENARKKAEDIIKKLKTGESFQQVAASFSQDDATKSNGGDLGWQKRGVLPEPIETTAFSLQPGQITEKPVETQNGFHIIQLLEKREAVGPEFEAAKPAIIADIHSKRGDETSNVSNDEIKKAYEAFHARQILIKVKSKDEIASEWIKNQRDKGKHKIVVVNPELDAYRYLNSALFNPEAGQPDLKKAVTLYEKAADVDPRNPYNYYELGMIYERMNAEETLKNAGGANDPYAKAIAEQLKNKPNSTGKTEKEQPKSGEVRNLTKAFEAYTRAKQIAEENNIYDPMILISLANSAKTLKKHTYAIDVYTSAIDFSAGNKNYLTQIKSGLTGYKSKKAVKALKDTDELLAEIEAIERENAAKEAAARGTAQPVAPVTQPAAETQQPAANAGARPTTAGQPIVKTFVVKPGKQPAAQEGNKRTVKTVTIPVKPVVPASKPEQTTPAPVSTPAPDPAPAPAQEQPKQ